MTTHEIKFRIENYVAAVIVAVLLVALIAHTQGQDEADDRKARAHVERVRVGAMLRAECVLIRVGDECEIKF